MVFLQKKNGHHDASHSSQVSHSFEDFLKSDVQGLLVLLHFKEDAQLQPKLRSLLARQVILNELSVNNGEKQVSKIFAYTTNYTINVLHQKHHSLSVIQYRK